MADLFHGLLEVRRCLTPGCRVQLVRRESRVLGICGECRARHARIKALVARVYGGRGRASESAAESRGKEVASL